MPDDPRLADDNDVSYAVNCSILFTELPMLERPAAAAAAGFDAIEVWWPFESAAPSDGVVDALVHAVEDAQVQLAALNFYAGDMAAGERGILGQPQRRNEFRESVEVAIGVGRRLGCSRFNALYGRRLPSVPPGDHDETAATQLAFAAEAVQSLDGVVLLEPLSGIDDFPLRTAGDCVSVIERLHTDRVANVALLADLYHLAVNGDPVAESIEKYSELIGHVQVADAPGRTEPGRGSLPLRAWLRQLADGGYTGCVGLEYVASGPSADSVQESRHYLSRGPGSVPGEGEG